MLDDNIKSLLEKLEHQIEEDEKELAAVPDFPLTTVTFSSGLDIYKKSFNNIEPLELSAKYPEKALQPALGLQGAKSELSLLIENEKPSNWTLDHF